MLKKETRYMMCKQDMCNVLSLCCLVISLDRYII